MLDYIDVEAFWMLALVFLLGTWNGLVLDGRLITWTTALIALVPQGRVLTRLFFDRPGFGGWRYLLANEALIGAATLLHIVITHPDF